MNLRWSNSSTSISLVFSLFVYIFIKVLYFLVQKTLAKSRILVTLFTTSKTALYSTFTIMLNKTVAHVSFIYLSFLDQSWSTIKEMAWINVTSLNKSSVHSLSQKSLLTPRMVRVSMNSWLKLAVFYRIFHDQSTSVGKKGTTVTTSKIFLYSIWGGFGHMPMPSTLAGGSKELGTGDTGFLKSQNFYEAILCTKYFFM